jgi:UPF0716 protein FxsA
VTPLHWLMAAFIIVPLLEIYLLLEVGSRVGVLPTVLLVVGTAVLGAWLVRRQGMSTLAKVQDALNRRELPALPLVEGAMLLLAGALLLTPGFFTDALGFLVLVSPLRERAARWLLARLATPASSTGGPPGPRILDGEYRRED